MSAPLVSVVLPVYNRETLVGEALDSILRQTFRDLEVIVVDDGSSDGTVAAVERRRDERIRLVHQENRGPAAAANLGIRHASGPLIARQDSDDIALPERLERQVAFLVDNPGVALVGCRARIVGDRAQLLGEHRHPVTSPALKFELLFNNPFVHSSTMVRRDALAAVGTYRDAAAFQPEDYDLWSRIARAFGVANLPEVLQIYRETSDGVSRAAPASVVEQVVRQSRANLAWWLDRPADDPHVEVLARVANGLAAPGSSRDVAREVVGLVTAAARAVAAGELEGCDELRTRVVARRRQVVRAFARSWSLPVRLGLRGGDAARRLLRAVTGPRRWVR